VTVVIFTVLLLAAGIGAAATARWFSKLDGPTETTWRFGVSLGAGIAAIILLAGSIMFPTTVIASKIICRNKAANLELPYRWSISAGCYVKFHGQWIGIDKALGIVTK